MEKLQIEIIFKGVSVATESCEQDDCKTQMRDLDICRLTSIPQQTFFQWKKRPHTDWRYKIYKMLKNMPEKELKRKIFGVKK